MLKFYKEFSLSTFLLCTLLIILFIASFFFPIEYSYENHLIENLEVLILLAGFILSLTKTLTTPLFDSIKFYISSSLIFLLMAMRELSWGRVFYPVGLTSNGEEIFIKVHELWYFDILYPLIAVLVIISITLIAYFYYQSLQKGIQWNIPIIEILIFILMSILSQCILDRGLIDYLTSYSQNLEECSELIAYLALVNICHKIKFSKHYIRITYFKMFWLIIYHSEVNRL